MDAVKVVHTVLYLLHMAGFFGLLVAGVLAMNDKAGAKAAAFHSSLLQLVTGLALVGTLYAEDEPVNNTKIGIKLLVLLVIAGLAAANRKKESLNKNVYVLIAFLAIANAALAWLW